MKLNRNTLIGFTACLPRKRGPSWLVVGRPSPWHPEAEGRSQAGIRAASWLAKG